MLLYINTADFKSLQIAMISKEKTVVHQQDVAFNENYKTLELIQKFLGKQGYPLSKIKRVIVNSGPGSFTGIRVGVALAQALGLGLNIPVLAIPAEKVPEDLNKLINLKPSKKLSLHYGAEPNITKPKSINKF